MLNTKIRKYNREMYIVSMNDYDKVGVFFQLSNEIIRRCSKEIDLDRIFDGFVQSSMKTLNECISCCEQWKDIYIHVIQLLYFTRFHGFFYRLHGLWLRIMGHLGHVEVMECGRS